MGDMTIRAGLEVAGDTTIGGDVAVREQQIGGFRGPT
jgi:hypothetical protein